MARYRIHSWHIGNIKAVSVIDNKTEEYAAEQLKKYDIVICGHTHIKKIVKYDNGKLYANCGTCQCGNFQGFILDTETDELIGVDND